jgi:hypothetical protein
MEEKPLKMKRTAVSALFLLPFVLGLIGYLYAGVPLKDAAYCAFVLYAVNPVSDKMNILIYIARWAAPAALASGFLLAARTAWQRVRSYFILLHHDAVQLCGDSPRLSVLRDALPHAVLAPAGVCLSRGGCIIDFCEEKESLAFLQKHEKELRGRSVLLCSDSVDMFRNDSEAFRIFNPTELIARDYWFAFPLPVVPGQAPELTVALIGFDRLGEKLLINAILNNVFHRDQRIAYHVFGDAALFRGVHSDLSLLTGDTVTYHDDPWTEHIPLLQSAQRIVFTRPPALDALLELQEVCLSRVQIDCRGLAEEAMQLLKRGQVRSFGRETDVLTEENVRAERLYDAAKRLNYQYACLYGSADGSWTRDAIEEEWNKLDSFTRHSNIASAEYHRMCSMLFPDRLAEPDDELAELEHIRWCRFHYLYHWRTGAGADGKKDPAARLHPCLVPYDRLSRQDQQKDMDSIRILNQVMERT